MERPDPALFARLSYYLGIASSGILLVGIVAGFLRLGISAIIWLALITSAVGTFMAWAARQDFKEKPGPDDVMVKARTGWRINLMAFILLVLLLVLSLVLRLIITVGPQVGR